MEDGRGQEDKTIQECGPETAGARSCSGWGTRGKGCRRGQALWLTWDLVDIRAQRTY